MIERMATHLANRIKNANPEETSDLDVLVYGIAMTMNLLGVIIGCVIAGAITGKIIGTMTAFAAFAVLRRFSGGHHAKSLGLCVVISVILFAVIPLIPISGQALIVMKVTSILLVTWLAPANCQGNDIPERLTSAFKMLSVVIVIGHLFIESSVVTLAVFSQSLLLIDIKRAKEVILR
ncbi:accessory gene regulator B family protein [Brevibacillus sp. HD3.3A]|uniref:accessory gene regulator B family protein n=1 Tax=Brevibacillus sp. HD3.3A TaxID=2738979 RepID=UPI00156B6A7E|nr:accessory gene regulator B family protein [Brevibacillus sp. HD3.3A]UED70723.1 accessory gene regulator B family protein [Brevibacillus sp. HD3.3A]